MRVVNQTREQIGPRLEQGRREQPVAPCEIRLTNECGERTTNGQIVFLWDRNASRRATVIGLIKRAGCDPVLIEWEGAKPWPGDPNAIAVIGLEDPAAHGDPVFEWIARNQGAGRPVIAYADGVNRWPLRFKCLPFLAGAAGLLDSADQEFIQGLPRLLAQLSQSQAETRARLDETRRLMVEHGVVGESAPMTDAFRAAIRFSKWSDLPVLITGESGTGKELLAKVIAKMDIKRHRGPFVPINCAAIQPSLLESEFFGHRHGAFTGAAHDRKGWVRAANGGVLFLDEIGELNLDLQAKLLRVLQENRILAVGEDRDEPVNVRFIAATNRNLDQLVMEGKFRVDLLHRLRVLVVHLPPLRERSLDTPLLARHCVSKHYASDPGSAPGISQDFLQALCESEWPGNVRQLENVVRQSLLSRHNPLQLELADLPVDILAELAGRFEPGEVQPVREEELGAQQPTLPQGHAQEFVKGILERQDWNFQSTLRECERGVLEAALLRTRGNQSEAARLLGITPRTIYNKIQKLGLSI